LNIIKAIGRTFRFEITSWKKLLFCFFVSCIFWVVNNLNKDYSTNVQFPVEFEFDTTKFVQAFPLPKVIELNVNSPGWDLVKKNLGFDLPKLMIPLTKPTALKRIPTNNFWPIIVNQLNPLIVNYAITDTLNVFIQTRIDRTVELVPDLNSVTFQEGYGRIGQVIIFPEEVTFNGPEHLLNQLPNPFPIFIVGNVLSDNFSRKVPVSISSQYIRVSPKMVEIKFEVGLVVEVTKNINLNSSELPWGVEFNVDSIECKFLVPNSRLLEFRLEKFEVVLPIDFDSLGKGEIKKIVPKLIQFPSFGELIKIDTIYVKRY